MGKGLAPRVVPVSRENFKRTLFYSLSKSAAIVLAKWGGTVVDVIEERVRHGRGGETKRRGNRCAGAKLGRVGTHLKYTTTHAYCAHV